MKSLVTGRRSFGLFAAAMLSVLLLAGAAVAKSTSVDSEIKLNSKIERLDRNASLPHGEQAVKDRLSKTFNLSGSRIETLREKNPGYGELTVILAIAEKMAGGMTDENIGKILKLRQGHKGWAEITRSVDVKLGSVLNRVDTIEKNANNDVKKAAAERPASGQGAGGKP